ncbi:unnamed protein product [Mytilus coruscus]|uniref:Uncharacterized protein n=1 Tax=Mytilus coruscus TaxID=42192 RepID=A0A6J8CMA5_MYTCO|nr:unnamed protein product [Mytilus coruscus]
MEILNFVFCFGGYPIKFDIIVEWECRERFQESDQTIISTFAEYCRKQQKKFAKGYIKSGVLYVTSGSKCLENDIAEIENNENNGDSYFFITCLRDTTDIVLFHDHLRIINNHLATYMNSVHIVAKKVSCSIKLKIPDVPASNEELSILCFVGNCYKIDSRILDKFTEYKVHIDLKNNECIRFAIVKSVITENFTVTGSQRTLTLQTIPGASIDLPPEMVAAQVAVSATKTEDENQKGEHKLICSDVLHIDICGKGSDKENKIHLPLHEKSPTNLKDVCILVSNLSKPNKQSDWSIIESGILLIKNGKVEFHSTFDIKCCVAVVKKFLDEAKTQVIRKIRGEHDIKIFAMLKHQQNEYSVIVGFALLKSFEERQKYWEKMEYKLESYVEETVRKNKPYKISFSGEIEVRGWNENDSIITYLPNKEDRMFQEYHLLNCNTDDKLLKPKCKVHIGGPLLRPTTESMIDKIKALFKNDNKPLNFEELTYLPIGNQGEKPVDEIVDGKPIHFPQAIRQ